MDPIENWYASDKPTNNNDYTSKTKEELIKHIKDAQYERGSSRGIACPLPPNLEARTKEDLLKLARHWYYVY